MRKNTELFPNCVHIKLASVIDIIFFLLSHDSVYLVRFTVSLHALMSTYSTINGQQGVINFNSIRKYCCIFLHYTYASGLYSGDK
jgi:hypothetical protein